MLFRPPIAPPVNLSNVFLFLAGTISAPQTLEADRLGAKSLETAVAFSQTLSQWCFVIIGATVFILVQGPSARPAKRYVRRNYLWFAPAWGFFATSIYLGTKAQRVYLGYLLNSATNWEGARTHLNPFMYWQIMTLEVGLAFLIPWLVVLLKWWVSDD
jgi:hypothetical protein